MAVEICLFWSDVLSTSPSPMDSFVAVPVGAFFHEPSPYRTFVTPDVPLPSRAVASIPESIRDAGTFTAAGRVMSSPTETIRFTMSCSNQIQAGIGRVRGE